MRVRRHVWCRAVRGRVGARVGVGVSVRAGVRARMGSRVRASVRASVRLRVVVLRGLALRQLCAGADVVLASACFEYASSV